MLQLDPEIFGVRVGGSSTTELRPPLPTIIKTSGKNYICFLILFKFSIIPFIARDIIENMLECGCFFELRYCRTRRTSIAGSIYIGLYYIISGNYT